MNMYNAAMVYAMPNNHRPPLHVFPLIPRAKEPLQKGGFYNASNNPDVVKEMWRRCPDANIGCRLINMVVLDVDAHDPNKDGADTLRELERKNGELPETWICLTPTGGAHYYFSTDDQRLTKAEDIADGLDYRGNLGYVLLPPSVHPCGGIYEWDAGHSPHETLLAPLPEWLHELMLKATAQQSSATGAKEVPDEIPDGQRNATLFKTASSLRSKGLTVEEMLPSMLEVNKRCTNPLDVNEVKNICKSTGRYKRGTAKKHDSLKPKDFSDSGLAEAFANYADNEIMYCPSCGWLAWTSAHWDNDEASATAAAMEYTAKLLEQALAEYKSQLVSDPITGKLTIPDEAEKFLKFAQKSRNALTIKNFMGLSKSLLGVSASELDADAFSINTPAGLVNLRSGKITPNDPTAKCTRITRAVPSTNGQGQWLDFIQFLTNGDSSYAEFLQIAKGSSLVGKVFEEKLFLLYGGGGNGKSTMTSAESIALGGYAHTITADLLLSNTNVNKGAGMAELAGRRFVICGELEHGAELSTSMLKRLCSTDEMAIEVKYHQPTKITPSHHVFLHTNVLPRIDAQDSGSWRRICVLPFTATMPEGTALVPNYADVLAANCGGSILDWLIRGAMKFCENGCRLPDPPEIVRKETAEYRNREDWLQRFISECCTADHTYQTKCGEVYERYRSYTESHGKYPKRTNEFATAMTDRGFRRKTIHGSNYWAGIALKTG